MGAARRLRRAQEKKAAKDIRPQILAQMGVDPRQPVSEEVRAMAAFREAAEYQQFLSEGVNHCEHTLEMLSEDHELHEYYVDAVKEVRERYIQARHLAHTLANVAADELEPKDAALIEVPNVVLAK